MRTSTIDKASLKFWVRCLSDWLGSRLLLKWLCEKTFVATWSRSACCLGSLSLNCNWRTCKCYSKAVSTVTGMADDRQSSGVAGQPVPNERQLCS